MNRSRFIESVYHVVFYGNTARNLNNILMSVADKITHHEKMGIRYSIQSNVMKYATSLIDELNKYLFRYNSPIKETKDKIISYKYIIEPILTEIDKWIDIRKFRNNILAHNFRIDSDNFTSVHLSNKLNNYNIPRSIMDLGALFKYLDVITKIAEEIFAAEYKEALAIVDSFEKPKKKLTQSIMEETKKTNLLLLEVNRRINEYNTQR